MTQPAKVTVVPLGPEGIAADTVITMLLTEEVYGPPRAPSAPDTVIVLPLCMKPMGKESVKVSWENKGMLV